MHKKTNRRKKTYKLIIIFKQVAFEMFMQTQVKEFTGQLFALWHKTCNHIIFRPFQSPI